MEPEVDSQQVSFDRFELHKPLRDAIAKMGFEKVDFLDYCVFFKNLQRSIKSGGTLILTVPSVESYLLTRIIQQQYNIDNVLLTDKTSKDKAFKNWKNQTGCRHLSDISRLASRERGLRHENSSRSKILKGIVYDVVGLNKITSVETGNSNY